MADPIDLPLEDDDRLAEPPLIDLMFHDSSQDAWVITFVPSDDVSAEPTEVVTIPRDTPEYRRINALLGRAVELILPGRSVEKVVHAGGGNYTLWFDGGTTLELADAPDQATTQEVADRLKQVADTAEAMFRVATRS